MALQGMPGRAKSPANARTEREAIDRGLWDVENIELEEFIKCGLDYLGLQWQL